MLEGQVQLVFQPELFDDFNNYTPQVGDTFDLIVAAGGIIADLAELELLNFVCLKMLTC